MIKCPVYNAKDSPEYNKLQITAAFLSRATHTRFYSDRPLLLVLCYIYVNVAIILPLLFVEHNIIYLADLFK